MKQSLFLMIIVLLIYINSTAQHMYGIVPPGTTATHKVYRYNQNNTLSFAFEFVATIGCNDIAISPDGKFYGVANPGIVYEIDTITGIITVLAQPLFPQVSNALVCSNDYKLYTLNGSGILTSYDILADTSEFVFDLGDAPTGDLTFYKGNLIFQSFSTGNIRAFNPDDKSLVDVFCACVNDIDTNYISFWGNSNYFKNCNSERIIAFERSGDMYELDIINNVAVNLFVDNSVLPVSCFMGAASSSEHLSSACNIVKLSDINCTVSVNRAGENKNVYLYPNPVWDMLSCESDLQIDLIEIYNLQGKIVRRILSPNNKIDMIWLEEGVYYLKIYSGTEIYTRKLIKLTRK